MDLEALLGLGVLALLIYLVVGGIRLGRWDKDPTQHELVELLVTAAHGNTAPVTNFIVAQSWSKAQARERLAHAVTLIQRMPESEIHKKAIDCAADLMSAPPVRKQS